MRWKPSGRVCSRKRRMNSSASSVMTFDLAAVAIILPAEGDLAVGHADQTGVGDGDAMGVAAEIGQHLFRSRRTAAWHRRPIRRRRASASRRAKARAAARSARSPKKLSWPASRPPAAARGTVGGTGARARAPAGRSRAGRRPSACRRATGRRPARRSGGGDGWCRV